MKKEKIMKALFVSAGLVMILNCGNTDSSGQGDIIRTREGIENYLGGARLPATATRLFFNISGFMDVSYHLAINIPETDAWPFIKKVTKIDRAQFKPLSTIIIPHTFKHKEWNIRKYASALAYEHLEKETKADGTTINHWYMYVVYDQNSGRLFWHYSTF